MYMTVYYTVRKKIKMYFCYLSIVLDTSGKVCCLKRDKPVFTEGVPLGSVGWLA